MISHERWNELWTLLWAIVDGKITSFRIQLAHGERPDHLDSAVDSFAKRKHLLLEHHTQRGTRGYYVRLAGVEHGKSAMVQNPFQTTTN